MPWPPVREVAAEFRRALPDLLGFEIVTRLLFGVLLTPLFTAITGLLLASRGEAAITNATIGGFLGSWQGVLLLVLGLGFLLFAVAAELGGALTISAQRLHGRPRSSYRHVLRHALGRTPNLLGAGGPVILFYLAVALPLTGAGPGISALSRVAVPQFVLAVIEKSPGLLAAYVGVVLVLLVAAVGLSYTFCFIVLGDLRAWPAVVASVRLVLARPGVWWREYLAPVIVAGFVVGLVGALWAVVALGLVALLEGHEDALWPVGAGLFLLQQLGVGLLSLLVIPFQVQRLVVAYHKALPGSGVPDLAAKARPSRLDRLLARPRTLLAVALGLVAALAWPGGLALREALGVRQPTTLVAHRAGGDGAPENSLAGLEYALAQRADMVEVDTQRTADGAYILNHDDTFARLAGDPRRPDEMTLAEVKALTLAGSAERVPTLEEFLLAARGRMPVMVELKGATADARMGEDVVALVERLGMREQVVLMSLNYPLVTGLERAHPDVTTAFGYFWSLGDVSVIGADAILLEEGEASLERLVGLAVTGKKSYVWTVNEPVTMQLVAARGAGGIITDEVEEGRRVLDGRATMGTPDAIRELLFGAAD